MDAKKETRDAMHMIPLPIALLKQNIRSGHRLLSKLGWSLPIYILFTQIGHNHATSLACVVRNFIFQIQRLHGCKYFQYYKHFGQEISETIKLLCILQ